jgi:hypothetical protein
MESDISTHQKLFPIILMENRLSYGYGYRITLMTGRRYRKLRCIKIPAIGKHQTIPDDKKAFLLI